MSLGDRAKRLDDTVLGPADSTRGFVFDVLAGLHPGLVPVWWTVALVCAAVGAVALITGQTGRGAAALAAAAGCAFMAYVSRGMPRTPRE